MKSRASYDYKIGTHNGKPYIAITDLDGIVSVTNDIENVVADICKKEGAEAEDHMVVYRDSNGDWDGWSPVSESFKIFSAESAQEALDLYCEHVKEP